MTLTRQSQGGDVARRMLNRWFSEGFGGPTYEASIADTAPSLNVRETPDAYLVEVELPGIDPEDVDVTLEGRTVTIRGSYQERDERQGTYLLREWRSGTFLRSVALPTMIDAEQASSEVRNGELILTLPKAAQHRARRLQIGGSTNARSTNNRREHGADTREPKAGTPDTTTTRETDPD
jgi:HSP20 family protein